MHFIPFDILEYLLKKESGTIVGRSQEVFERPWNGMHREISECDTTNREIKV